MKGQKSCVAYQSPASTCSMELFYCLHAAWTARNHFSMTHSETTFTFSLTWTLIEKWNQPLGWWLVNYLSVTVAASNIVGVVFFWLKITLEGSLSLCILNEKLAGHLGKVFLDAQTENRETESVRRCPKLYFGQEYNFWKAYFRPIEFGSFIFLAFLNFCLLPLLYAVQLIRLKNNQLIDKNPSQPQLIVRNNNVTQEQSKKASQLQSRKQRNVSENSRDHSMMIIPVRDPQ